MTHNDRDHENEMISDAETRPSERAQSTPAPWWRGAVIYQVYPLSFMDSNGDGYGDLRGVIAQLDHIASLGVDAIWLSPFYASPLADFGYDIADHCAVDPLFGSMADAEALIAAAHARGMKLIVDFVPSHTSDKHAWFLESAADSTNSKADWYVWANAKADGAPPTNWQSVFGGPAWTWHAKRKQYYLHNFLSAQPDLNLHNPAVQDAMLGVAKFWLEKGVDGFRVDAINFAMHDPQLRDNPPSGRSMDKVTRPFDMQAHLYNQSHEGIPHFLRRLRRLTDSYPNRFTVAEVGGDDSLREMKLFTAGDAHLNSAYDFTYLYAQKLSPDVIVDGLSHWRGNADEGWPSWAFSNHDAPRHVSRWAGAAHGESAARATMMVLLSLRGNAFIYQGEELGLPQGDVSFADLKDPEAIANWPLTLGRDGARTPMPWRGDAPNLGFSTQRPWLPASANHAAYAVDRQLQDANSCLHFMKRALSVRRSTQALRHGAITIEDSPTGVLRFTRQWQGQTCDCVFNLTDSPVAIEGLEQSRVLLSSHILPPGPVTTLPPWSGLWRLA